MRILMIVKLIEMERFVVVVYYGREDCITKEIYAFFLAILERIGGKSRGIN